MKNRETVKIDILFDTQGDTEDSRAIATLEVPRYLYGWKLIGYKWESLKTKNEQWEDTE